MTDSDRLSAITYNAFCFISDRKYICNFFDIGTSLQLLFKINLFLFDDSMASKTQNRNFKNVNISVVPYTFHFQESYFLFLHSFCT